MNFEERLDLTILGAVLGFILAYALWWVKELRIAKKQKKNITRVIHADIKATLKTLDGANSYEIKFNKLKPDEVDPLILFNPSRMNNFFLDFKEDIYLIPPALTEDLLEYYDVISACMIMCDAFKTEDFRKLPFERKRAGYLRWVTRLKEASDKGGSLEKRLYVLLK